MSNVKAVIFDYGGVISPGGGNMEGFLERMGLTDLHGTKDANKHMWPLFGELLRGNISEEQFFTKLEQAIGIRPVNNWVEVWTEFITDDMAADQEMLSLVRGIKNQGVYVGLLSNMTPLGAKILKKLGYYDAFEGVLLSCNQHIKKPDQLAFEQAIDMSGCAAGHCLMVDDVEKNILAAQELGMQTYHAAEYDCIVPDLSNLI